MNVSSTTSHFPCVLINKRYLSPWVTVPCVETEMNLLSETHTKTVRIDISANQRFYTIPNEAVKILDIRCKHHNNTASQPSDFVQYYGAVCFRALGLY